LTNKNSIYYVSVYMYALKLLPKLFDIVLFYFYITFFFYRRL